MNVTFDRPGWSYEILKALHVFHQQEEYCDVVVVCNDKKIRAHSCVLAAASPWVASELQCGSSEGPVQIVSLEDTPSQVVQYIMTFVYTGQFKVPLKHIKEAQSLASRLGIRCLKDRNEDDDGSGDEGSHGDHGNNHGNSPPRDIPARARGAGRRASDLEHRVPDSSLPSDTVVTLNRDWCEADSTPSASQSDSTPSVSQSTSLTLPSSSTPDTGYPTPSLSQTPLPGTSRSSRLKRAAQDHEDIKPDTPPKRKRGRPRKSGTIATPPVATATEVNRSGADVDLATRPQALPETLGTDMVRADQLKQDTDNDSFHDDDPPDNSICDDGIQDDQEANHSEGGKQATREVNKGPESLENAQEEKPFCPCCENTKDSGDDTQSGSQSTDKAGSHPAPGGSQPTDISGGHPTLVGSQPTEKSGNHPTPGSQPTQNSGDHPKPARSIESTDTTAGPSVSPVSQSCSVPSTDTTPAGSQSEQAVTEPSLPYKRRHRRCPFCDKPNSKLSRHIRAKHRDNERVATALTRPRKERTAMFARFRNEGIMNENKQRLKQNSPDLVGVRRSNTPGAMVICGACSGFYSRKCFYKHKQLCRGADGRQPFSVSMEVLRGRAQRAHNQKGKKTASKVNPDVCVVGKTSRSITTRASSTMAKAPERRSTSAIAVNPPGSRRGSKASERRSRAAIYPLWSGIGLQETESESTTERPGTEGPATTSLILTHVSGSPDTTGPESESTTKSPGTEGMVTPQQPTVTSSYGATYLPWSGAGAGNDLQGPESGSTTGSPGADNPATMTTSLVPSHISPDTTGATHPPDTATKVESGNGGVVPPVFVIAPVSMVAPATPVTMVAPPPPVTMVTPRQPTSTSSHGTQTYFPPHSWAPQAQQPSKDRGFYRWSDEETWLIKDYFKQYIHNSTSTGNKGTLPGKAELVEFIRGHPSVGASMSYNQKVKVIKTKIFNERGKARRLSTPGD